MKPIEVIRLVKELEEDAGQSEALLERALSAIQASKSQVDAQKITRALAPWGRALLGPGRELLASKKGGDRQKGIELFAIAADPTTLDELEQAKKSDRSKKLAREYDYAIRRIQKAASQRSRATVDPRDASIDPVARLVELDAMDADAFETAIGRELVYWEPHHRLPWLDFDREGRRAFPVGSEVWQAVFDPETGTLALERPDGKVRKSAPKSASEPWKALRKEIRRACDKRAARLEEAIRTGTPWPAWLWRLIYVDHPLADATRHTVVFEAAAAPAGPWTAFRVLASDGRETIGADGDPVEVARDAHVRVAHPVDIGESLAVWRRVADSEQWAPPFAQLDRASHPRMTEAELAKRVQGLNEVFAKTLASRLARYDFELGPVDEHATVAERYRPLGERFSLWIRHSAMPVRQARMRKDQRARILHAELRAKGKPVAPARVAPRAFSEAMLLLDALTA